MGYKNIRIIAFYDASDYFRFFFPFYIVVTLWERICRKLKIEQLCSGFIIVAEKKNMIDSEGKAVSAKRYNS